MPYLQTIERPVAQWAQGDALRLFFPLHCISLALEWSFPVLSASYLAANTRRSQRGFQPSPSSLVFLRCGYCVPLAWEQSCLTGCRKPGIRGWGRVWGGTAEDNYSGSGCCYQCLLHSGYEERDLSCAWDPGFHCRVVIHCVIL